MKKHVTVTLDEEIIEKAKDQNINISGVANDYLKEHLRDKTLDFEKTGFVVKCSLCFKEINEGYFCKEQNLIICSDCQPDFKMADCPHTIEGYHYHHKFPGPVVKPEGLESGD